MKKVIKICIILLLCLSSVGFVQNTHGAEDYVEDVLQGNKNLDEDINTSGQNNSDNNSALTNIKSGDDRFYSVGNSGGKGISEVMIRIAKALKNIFFIVATIYFLIITLRLLTTENSEEEFGKFKKGLIWITIGIIVMQLAFSFVNVLFDRGVSGELAKSLLDTILRPLISLLETAASFFFIAVALFAFYRMITANGDEEKAKTGKMSVLYAIIGFIVIKISSLIAETTYSSICEKNGISCSASGTAENIAGAPGIIIKVINWMNGFVGIAVVLMIIYVGAQVLISGGEEEKIKKSKSAIIGIIIGIIILSINYFILTFFLLDNISPAITTI